MMKREQELFEQALALPSHEAREAFLFEACGQDLDLHGLDQVVVDVRGEGPGDLRLPNAHGQDDDREGAEGPAHQEAREEAW